MIEGGDRYWTSGRTVMWQNTASALVPSSVTDTKSADRSIVVLCPLL